MAYSGFILNRQVVKSMNKILLSLSLILTLLAGSLYLFVDKEDVLAGIGAFGLTQGANNPEVSNGARLSTSTLNYLSIGAGTTTVTANTRGTDQIDVNVFVLASSTQADLRWRVEYSHSTTSVAGDQLWFPEPVSLNELATTTRITQTSREYQYVFASTTSHRLATSTTANNTFVQNNVSSFTFRIKDIAANWTRVVFYVPTGASTANDERMDTLAESTALGVIPIATSTNVGIFVQVVNKDPL